MNLAKLREKTPAGCNLAMEVALDYAPATTQELINEFALNGCPVTDIAKGALGVLRAMDIPGKRPGIIARMHAEGGEHRILHLVFADEIVHSHKFIVRKDFTECLNQQ